MHTSRLELTIVLPVAPAAAEGVLSQEPPLLGPRAEEALVTQGRHVLIPVVAPIMRSFVISIRVLGVSQPTGDLIKREVVHRTANVSAFRDLVFTSSRGERKGSTYYSTALVTDL